MVQERDLLGEGAHWGNRLDFEREELLEIGIDASRRDILSYVDSTVPWAVPGKVPPRTPISSFAVGLMEVEGSLCG